jgi:hypothetical protein
MQKKNPEINKASDLSAQIRRPAPMSTRRFVANDQHGYVVAPSRRGRVEKFVRVWIRGRVIQSMTFTPY